MALFGNKSKDPNGSAPGAPPTADPGKKPGRSLSFGRKKDTAPAVPTAAPGGPATAQGGAEDFSDFAESVLAAPGANEAAPSGKVRRGKAGGNKPTVHKIKTGTVVGVNIGNSSIKAVELKVKANEIELTAMAMVPTPEESISNGVIMSVTALANALRDLFKEGGFSSRHVVSSVAGTGALVVRVIEVPEMDDKELASNMKVDADRYIPFPPSEVIMDFKALRELPRDPASGNMEVLLAAAQREVIDLHVGVLQAAKLNPAAVDVEPLAAARAVIYGARGTGESGAIDYRDVSAIMNIGATGTEISVLRGDILVFTRAIPIGGNIITQQIVDNLALPWYDAERLKQEMGDALPPHTYDATASGQGHAVAGDGADDWSSFNNFDTEPATSEPIPTTYPAATATGTGILEEDWPTAEATHTEAIPAETTHTGAHPPGATPENAAADPFDLDFFSQGPRQDEPHEQHSQKEDEPEGKPVHSFDFSNFDLDEPVAATPAAHDAATSAEAPAAPPTNAPAEAPKAPSFDFSFPGDDEATPAPAPAAFNFDSGAAPTATPVAKLEEPAAMPAATTPAAPATSAFSGFAFDMPDAETAPPAELVPAPTIATSPTVTAADAEMHPASSPSAYDLSDIDVTDLHPAASGLDMAAMPPVAAIGSDDLDLDSLFNAGPVTTAASGFDATPSVPAPSAADDFGMDFADFGMGLTGGGSVAHGVTNDADAVHAILRPILEELAGEVRRSLEYYASRYPDTVVSHVTLIGGGAKLKNIDAFFTQMLGIPTTVSVPTARLTIKAPKLQPGYADANGPTFAVAIGLALRDAV